MATSKPKAAAIYARISKADKDPLTGELKTLKVEDQVERCRAWAEANGWGLADFIPEAGEVAPKRRNSKKPVPPAPKPDTPGCYIDNDVSATKARPRPQYVVMLRDAEAGHIDGIISVDADRLTRAPIELEQLIQLNESRGVELATLGGLVDLNPGPGRMVARTLGNAAALEAELKAIRQKRQNEARALRGEAYGGMRGNTRPFGWEDGGMVIHKAEAAQIADAIDQLLKGANFRPIVDRWNREGLATARGGPWTLTNARQVLTRWRNAAIVHRNGVPVGPGNWEPIVSLDTLAAIRDHFDSRKLGKKKLVARTYLLSNIAVCGRCGSPLRHGIANVKDKSPQDTYRCNNFGGGAGCGLNISRAILDKAVTQYVVSALWWPNSAIRTQTSADAEKVTALRKRKAELEAEADEIARIKALSPSKRAVLVSELEEDIRALDAELERLRTRDALASLILELAPIAFTVHKSGKKTVPFTDERYKEIRARFDALGGDDIGPKRAVVRAVCESITVQPHPKGVKPTTQSAHERIVIVGVGEDEPALA